MFHQDVCLGTEYTTQDSVKGVEHEVGRNGSGTWDKCSHQGRMESEKRKGSGWMGRGDQEYPISPRKGRKVQQEGPLHL